MRIYLYILAGITSALIGWNIGQFLLTDQNLLKEFSEVILFPCIAISLAIGMVLTEIFISNPTRPKLNLRIAGRSLILAAGLGLLAGLIAGGLFQILSLPQIQIFTPIKRIVSWLLIGGSTGLAEGQTWRWRSIEAGDKKRFRQRCLTSLVGSLGASFTAALIFEILRNIGTFPPELKGAEDPLGFSILGLLLGLVFSVSTSPSYMVALRAGAGFEYTGENIYDRIDELKPTPIYPTIETKESRLKFVTDSEAERIEEGLSIQLPPKGKIRIGSADKAHIRIHELPLHVADLELKPRETLLVPNSKFFYTIEVNGEQLTSRTPIALKHNYVLTFYPQDKWVENEQTFFRFVYYNRFLDPQA